MRTSVDFKALYSLYYPAYCKVNEAANFNYIRLLVGTASCVYGTYCLGVYVNSNNNFDISFWIQFLLIVLQIYMCKVLNWMYLDIDNKFDEVIKKTDSIKKIQRSTWDQMTIFQAIWSIENILNSAGSR